jgi:hypothetical protein
MLVLCFGCAPIASTSSPTQTKEIILSPTSQKTATPTEEVLTVSTPTPAPTQTQEIIPPLTTQVTATPIDEVFEKSVNDARTGLDEVDLIIHVVLSGDINEIRQRIKFTTSGCTHEMALGGPPKCREGESEDKLVEVLPFLGPEGHFLRRDELNEWRGIDVAGLYAVYRVSDEAYSNENYPAGEYGIVFRTKSPNFIVTLQVENGSILRIDSLYGTPPEINFERDAQEIILPPGLYIFKGCQGAPLQHVMIGEKARVCTKSDDLIVREAPGIEGEELTRIKPGTDFMIIDGPSCANNWSWWKVELDSGLEGWVAEGDDNIDTYFICPEN